MKQPTVRICLVEDHQDTRELLATLLVMEGYTIRTVASCAQAREALASDRYDVLLSDIGLPDGDGWTLLSSLSAEHRPADAIAMSGFGASSDSARSEVRSQTARGRRAQVPSKRRRVRAVQEASASKQSPLVLDRPFKLDKSSSWTCIL